MQDSVVYRASPDYDIVQPLGWVDLLEEQADGSAGAAGQVTLGAVMKQPIELLRSHARSTDGHSRLQLVATGKAILHPRAGVILPIVYESARLVVELVVMESADGAVLRREETERVRMPCRE
ncbi:MAG TPA: hypothetical protein VKI99_13670 [Candidatus Dormibacteraeota bacterium]|nr:hypothetical protein [Candidatus Dormibacteraeota bacterium]